MRTKYTLTTKGARYLAAHEAQRATAAAATFPYAHRSLAELDAAGRRPAA
jgi:hypothetical protein